MNNNNTKNRYLAKNIIIFAVGNIGTKIINFLLVPFYSYVLSTEEYGTVDLIFTVFSIVVPVLTLNICEAVQRFSMDENADHRLVFTNSVLVNIGGFIFGLLVIPISYLFFKEVDISLLIYLYIFSYSSYLTLSFFLRGREELLKYSLCSIFLTLLLCCLNILFLVVLKTGIKGYISAYALSYLIMSFIVLVLGKQWRFFNSKSINKSFVKKLVKFSIALVPNSLLWWIVNSSDRLMVTGMCGISMNGLYAMSYKIPSLLSVGTTIFMQAWGFSAVKESEATTDTSYQRDVFKKFLSIVSIFAIFIILALKPAVTLLLSDAYYDSWKFSPFLVLGFVFVSLASFAGTTYYVEKDSLRQMYSAIVGAILNVVLNFALIPTLGANGASIATCISYFMIFIYRLIDTKKKVNLEFGSTHNIIMLILVALSVMCVYLNNFLVSEISLGVLFTFSVMLNFKDMRNLLRRIWNRKVKE